MKTSFKFLAAAVLVTAGVAQATTVNLIKNGGFKTPDIPGNSISQLTNDSQEEPFGWITGPNGVELRDSRNFPSGYTHLAADDDSQYVELAVEGNVETGNSYIYQLVDLVLGQEYILSFAYSPRAPFGEAENQALVTFGKGQVPTDFLYYEALSGNTRGPNNEAPAFNNAIDLWERVTVKLIGTGQREELRFAATGSNGSYGMLFDDVSLTATPLPGAALLFGTSIAGFLAARKRRKAAALAV